MKYDLLLDYPNSTDPNLIKILNETNEIFRSKYMEDTLQKIEELCKKAGVPKGFKHYTWDPDVEARLDAVNYPRDGGRGWGHLSENGFWGNELDALAEGESWKPFTNWNDLIQLIGRAMYCHRGLHITKA